MNYGPVQWQFPVSKREQRLRHLRYRFRPPVRPEFNRLQRAIWRLQRLLLGDNNRRKELRRRDSSGGPVRRHCRVNTNG